MHCIGANYQTQLWQLPDACTYAQAIRKRLGWQHSAYQRKPKDMHRTTHKRLFLEYIDIEDSYVSRLESIDKLINTGVIKNNHQLERVEEKSEEARRIGSKTAHFSLFLFSGKSVPKTDSDGSRYSLGSKKWSNSY